MKADSFVDFQNSQKQSSASSGGLAFETGQTNQGLGSSGMTADLNLPSHNYYCQETERDTEQKRSLHDPPSFSKLQTAYMESDVGSEQTQVQNYTINLYGFASESDPAPK